MSGRRRVTSLLLWVAACGGGTSNADAKADASASADAKADAKTDAKADASTAACVGAEREGGPLHWFRDDYPRALACARSKNVPLVIDMWAPWCHTCLSMQAYVLTDERLADYDRRFVFLALDTDREANAAPVAAFPPAAWPTFFVVSPTDESIQSRFVGGGSVEQIARLLDDGERGHQALQGGTLASHEAHARDGDRAASRKAWLDAGRAYAEALAQAPADWPRGPDTMVSLLAASVRGEAWTECEQVVRQHLDQTGTSASASDFAAHALRCAEGQTDAARGKALREAVVVRLSALSNDASAKLSVDDRSDLLMYLREAQAALGRTDDARTTADRQRTLLDEAAQGAEPRLAMIYNWPRAEVYAYLDRELELVPALQRSVADLPQEYDPPYRLAWLLLEASKPDDALTAATQAEALAYGPRKARVQALLAQIHAKRGDRAAERAARAAALATLEALPEAARNPEAIDAAKRELAAVGGA